MCVFEKAHVSEVLVERTSICVTSDYVRGECEWLLIYT